MTIGHCPHGEFDISQGCPKCIEERIRPLSMDDRMGILNGSIEPRMGEDIGESLEITDQLLEESVPESKPEPDTTALINIRPSSDITIKALFDEAVQILDNATTRQITKPEDLKLASDDLLFIRKIKKALEEKRKEYLKPLDDYMAGIRGSFDIILEPILEADKIIGNKILSYQKEQARLKAEAEAIRKEQEELARRAEAIGEKPPEEILVPEIEMAPRRIQTEIAEVGQRKIWKWELIDFAAVPDFYKVLNNGAITNAVKAAKGSIEIPGIRIFLDTTLQVKER